MADKRKTSNAEPMAHVSSIVPNLRDQMAREKYLASREAAKKGSAPTNTPTKKED